MAQARLNVWDDWACGRVHEGTQKVPEMAGAEVMHERARETLRAAGARVDGTRVRFPAALVDQALSLVTTGHLVKPRGGDTAPLELGVATVMGALSRATLLHDVGYLESGLQSALEAMVLGDEMAGYARTLLEEVPVDDEALQLAEIIAVGPGGNHLARPFTRAHYRRFRQPGLLDQSVYDRWQAGGATTLRERVQARTLDLVSGSPRPWRLVPTSAGSSAAADGPRAKAGSLVEPPANRDSRRRASCILGR